MLAVGRADRVVVGLLGDCEGAQTREGETTSPQISEHIPGRVDKQGEGKLISQRETAIHSLGLE